MSIVEKVIDQQRRNNLKKDQAAAESAVPALGQSIENDASQIVGVKQLRDRGLVTVFEDRDLSSGFRFLKRSVLAKVFGPARTQPDIGKAVMITSAMPGAGKSFTAFNLAASIALEQLVNVVLIDADIVRHNLSSILDVQDHIGLLDILPTGDIERGIVATDLPGLRFIPAGQMRDDATEMLASKYMSNALELLNDPNTIVVLDTTPLLVASEADAMSAHADHVIVVVEAGGTSADEIDTVLQMLEKSGSPVSFIMNKVKTPIRTGGPDYYYSY